MTTSDGSTADYYELPAGATQLQDLISHRDMNAQLGEIFRAAYRYGMASHSGKLRDAKKIKFYVDAEIKRLEALSDDRSQREHNQIVVDQADLMIVPDSFGQQNMLDPEDVDIASAIDDDSERMQAIGQNGEMADEVYAAVDGVPSWNCAPEWANWLAQDMSGMWFWFDKKPFATSDDEWFVDCADYEFAIDGAENSLWRETLQPRPAK